MKFKIHNCYDENGGDSFFVSGETIEECQNKTAKQMKIRNWKEAWSEPI